MLYNIISSAYRSSRKFEITYLIDAGTTTNDRIEIINVCFDAFSLYSKDQLNIQQGIYGLPTGPIDTTNIMQYAACHVNPNIQCYQAYICCKWQCFNAFTIVSYQL